VFLGKLSVCFFGEREYVCNRQMNEITNKKDIRIFEKKIYDICGSSIIRHTCQFFIKSGNELKPFGSGVFVKSENKHFILTASHVAELLENNNENLFIKVDHKNYINVLGQIWMTEIEKSNSIDIAIIRIDEQMLPALSKPYIFLPISKFRKHDKLLNAPHYAVIGYPSINVKKENGFLETGATIYLTSPSKEKVYKYYGFDPKHFYILEMEGKGNDLTTGNKSKINDKFHGISGCGLWLMFTHKEEKEYKVDYRLIGIMTEFRKGKYYCLIGNKIQIVIDALIKLEDIKIKTLKK